ncbi:PadR family transcriptional regulator [Sphingomonas sp.]|uniref:PadR family transcriptional regulator n=1 Tax=Sphingomonas sp. TaxID=28214 RepID=UPI003B001053
MFGFHHGRSRDDQHSRAEAWRAVRSGWGRHGGSGFAGEDGIHGGGRRRVFDGGELRLVLLRLIADRPSHGYDLIRAIEERTGGAYAPSPGVVYPTLTMLGDMEQIAEQPGEGTRRVFAVAEEGRRVLADKAKEVEALMHRLDAIGAMRARTEGGSIRRAMHNLKAVLQHKLAGEAADRATIEQAVALIDDAAQRIERL